MDVEAARRGAHLARVGELRLRGLAGGLHGVGVGADDHRGVAAQLHQGGLHDLACLGRQQLADRDRAGEGDQPGDGGGDEVRGDLGGLTEDEVEDPGGQARVLVALDQRGGGGGRLLGALDDDRAARGEGRGDLAVGAADGEVPRYEGGDRADGLAPYGQYGAGLGRDDAAVGAAGVVGVPAQGVGGAAGLAGGLGERLALLQGADAADLGARSAIRSAAACRIAVRRAIGVARQTRKPSSAAASARSRSAVVARGTSPMTSSVAGFTIGAVRPVPPWHHSPAMYMRTAG